MFKVLLLKEKKGKILIFLHIKSSVSVSQCGLASHLSPTCVCEDVHVPTHAELSRYIASLQGGGGGGGVGGEGR